MRIVTEEMNPGQMVEVESENYDGRTMRVVRVDLRLLPGSGHRTMNVRQVSQLSVAL